MSSTQAGSQLFMFYALLVMELGSPCCSEHVLECIAPHSTVMFRETMAGSYLIKLYSKLNKSVTAIQKQPKG